MGASLLSKPKTEKHGECGSGNGLSYGLSSMQGWREEMEDAHCAVVGLPQGLKDWSFFAVFDGHCGARVSKHSAENLLETILQSEDFPGNANCNKQVSVEDAEQVNKQVLVEDAEQVNKQVLVEDAEQVNKQVSVEDAEQVKKGIREGFLKLDESMREIPELASGEDKSGSTAVCALISGTHFFFANCGDSRAVLSRDKKVFFATKDHDLNIPAERDRIQKAGGYVESGRVKGQLAMSRALGDYEYKQVKDKGPCEQMVTPEPEVNVVERDNDLDEFLVVACDGVWDVLENSEICHHIRYLMQVSSDLEYICNCVMDACLYKSSKDNMSIVLVSLPGAPKVSEQMVRRDTEINILLEERIKEIFSDSKKLDTDDVMSVLQNDEKVKEGLVHLPLGGFFFKYTFVEEVCKKLGNRSPVNVEEKTESQTPQFVFNAPKQEDKENSSNESNMAKIPRLAATETNGKLSKGESFVSGITTSSPEVTTMSSPSKSVSENTFSLETKNLDDQSSKSNGRNSIFGQNLHERALNNDSQNVHPSSPTTDSHNLTFEEVALKKEELEKMELDNQEEKLKKSLFNSAKEYESKQVKRKFDEVTVVSGEEEESNVLQVPWFRE